MGIFQILQMRMTYHKIYQQKIMLEVPPSFICFHLLFYCSYSYRNVVTFISNPAGFKKADFYTFIVDGNMYTDWRF